MDRAEEKKLFHQQVLDHFGLVEATRVDASFEHLRGELGKALNEWPGRPASNLEIAYTFSNRVIAYSWSETLDAVPYKETVWEVPYTKSGDGGYEFGQPIQVKMAAVYEPVGESLNESLTRRKLLEEDLPSLELVESLNGNGSRNVKAFGITADVVNANGRLYPWQVLAEAVKNLNLHLHESSGQARLIATGEAEHPSDKNGRSNILETVVAWNSAALDAGGRVVLEGQVLPTSKGRDVQVLLESGVRIGVSMRGKGSTRPVNREGKKFDEVTQLTIGAFDLVANPSDPNGAIIESAQPEAVVIDIQPVVEETSTMDVTKEQLEALQKELAASQQQLQEASAAKEELAQLKLQESITATITAGTKDLAYPGELNKLFLESVAAAKPTTPEAAKALIESKRREYDAIASGLKLGTMGKDIQVVGPVFESRTGQAAFTQASYEISESLITHGEGRRLAGDLQETPGGIYARRVLARFDAVNQQHLAREAREFNEAMTTSDLNLPYSVARMLIEQAYPGLVAASIYDFGPTDVSPARIYYETYTGDTGSYATITDEAHTASLTAFVPLAHKRVRPGTVVVTSSPAGTTYVEGTDYVVDYEVGAILAIATITGGQSLLVDYTYDAFREGEGTAIERAENNLSFTTLEMAADRLAMEVTTEAILFSRSQLQYDAVNRTLGNLVKLVKRKIDKDILYKGLAAALRQANNSGGTWTSASDAEVELVEKIGVAKTKVSNRFYIPTAIVMSDTNSDRLSNWDGFKVMGFDNAVLNAAGFVGRVKGLPVFSSPEYPDTYIQVINRELVMHRVYEPMRFKGPYPSIVNGKLIASEQYYVEEFNGSAVPVIEKTSYVKVV